MDAGAPQVNLEHIVVAMSHQNLIISANLGLSNVQPYPSLPSLCRWDIGAVRWRRVLDILPGPRLLRDISNFFVSAPSTRRIHMNRTFFRLYITYLQMIILRAAAVAAVTGMRWESWLAFFWLPFLAPLRLLTRFKLGTVVVAPSADALGGWLVDFWLDVGRHCCCCWTGIEGEREREQRKNRMQCATVQTEVNCWGASYSYKSSRGIPKLPGYPGNVRPVEGGVATDTWRIRFTDRWVGMTRQLKMTKMEESNFFGDPATFEGDCPVQAFVGIDVMRQSPQLVFWAWVEKIHLLKGLEW